MLTISLLILLSFPYDHANPEVWNSADKKGRDVVRVFEFADSMGDLIFDARGWSKD